MDSARLGISGRIGLAFGSILLLLGGMTGLAAAAATPTFLTEYGLAALLFGSGFAWWLLRGIGGPLRQAVAVTRQVAGGDLTAPLPEGGRGESAALMQALRELSAMLFKIVSEVRTGTTIIATSSGQISADNAALAARTEAQASSLEETASAMEQLTSAVRQNAEHAQQAHQLVESACSTALRGGTVVGQVVSTMGSIQQSSKKIADIIGVIDGIAFQTNILALNAAVEAARAGEQGRGFAVVATEVRNLAQRSATASREIKALIGDSVEKVEAGGTLVGEAGQTMKEIVDAIRQVADIMRDITAASQEQSSGIDEVNRAIIQIDQTTQQNARLVDGAVKVAAGLQTQAVSLLAAVAGFDLGAAEFGNADEAAGMVKKGIAFLQAGGKQRMLDEVNGSSAQFRDRDLYLSIYDLDSVTVAAHATNPRLLGTDITTIKDSDGRLFIKQMAVIANRDGGGWIDYKWNHPVTGESLVKSAFFEKAGQLIIACGFYKKSAAPAARLG
jgi:methyl-accepting chemotaxis protein